MEGHAFLLSSSEVAILNDTRCSGVGKTRNCEHEIFCELRRELASNMAVSARATSEGG